MTFIQPHTQKNILTFIIASLVIPLMVGVVWVIMLYNQTVDLRHSAASMELQLKSLEIKNTELKDGIFSLFDTAHVEALVASRGLVKDKKPSYLESTTPWVIASHY